MTSKARDSNVKQEIWMLLRQLSNA
ncbi:hypothetical protein KL86DPRO_20266 [uncultured delta proteobacterium]|uniref:Uncharacterized protein n=1 Tax=uncultured delta proteobacterium TaxID=34034 RepID=A0A212JXL7_9DELT|nr:hypothetical protein KL86DPRO_20266 [uncultured delta proteobacterium]